MTAGQIWRRPDGLTWVEVQTASVDPSGWRLMVPLVDLADAPDAPPLVITMEGWRARAHLLTSAPHDGLGAPEGALTSDDTRALRDAVRSLLGQA